MTIWYLKKNSFENKTELRVINLIKIQCDCNFDNIILKIKDEQKVDHKHEESISKDTQ